MSTAERLVSLKMRSMVESDLDEVSHIERESFSTPWSFSTFRNLLNRRDADLWVATVEGAIVGYTVIWFVGEEAELGNLSVMLGWRRRGLGRRLLERAIEGASEREATRIFLEVRVSNSEARLLYERRGFKVVGLRRRYYRAPVEDARVMSLELPGAVEGSAGAG